jgi:16S rRNA (uracil1498-N3)-methyltransferase
MRSVQSDAGGQSVSAARRFFVEGTLQVGSAIEIEGSDAHKIARVLRLVPGDRIEVIDSAATAYRASLENVGRTVRATLLERLDEPLADSLRIDVAQAIPKGNRMDFVVEKGTELGAAAFLPFYSERCVGREVGDAKLGRWRRLARSAAQQSGRRDVPEILEPLRYDALLERFEGYERVLFAWELTQSRGLRDVLAATLPASGSVLLVVGPEGGFTHAEAEAAVKRRATLVSLGSRILRTDTAAVALLAVIGALAS